jgi:polar amino acid transport system permease protein
MTFTDAALLQAKLVPRRRPSRWATGALTLVLAAMLLHTLLTNHRFEWSVVGHYLTDSTVIAGLELTLWLTAATMAAGFILGIALAYVRLWGSPIPRAFAFGYVWLIRSVPLLLQLLFWYELASLYPKLSIGIPFGPTFATTNTAHLFSGELAAFVTLTLDIAAFSSEVIRGGILSVDQGQTEAAQSLGLSRIRTFRRIVLPQAMPAIVPATGNMLIGTLKSTSLVSVIAVVDLLYSVQLIYNANFQVIPLLLVATAWYLLLTTILSIGQHYIERHYARGNRGGA